MTKPQITVNVRGKEIHTFGRTVPFDWVGPGTFKSLMWIYAHVYPDGTVLFTKQKRTRKFRNAGAAHAALYRMEWLYLGTQKNIVAPPRKVRA